MVQENWVEASWLSRGSEQTESRRLDPSCESVKRHPGLSCVCPATERASVFMSTVGSQRPTATDTRTVQLL